MIEVKTRIETTVGGELLPAGAEVASIIPAVCELNPEELLQGIQSGRFTARRIDDPRDVKPNRDEEEDE